MEGLDMIEPTEISVPSDTGWLAPEKEQPEEDGIWEGRIYGIEWEVGGDKVKVKRAKVAFRKIRASKFFGFTRTMLKVSNIRVYKSKLLGDNRFLSGNIREEILTECLNKHSLRIGEDFLEWVLEPAVSALTNFHTELEEQLQNRPSHLRSVA